MTHYLDPPSLMAMLALNAPIALALLLVRDLSRRWLR